MLSQMRLTCDVSPMPMFLTNILVFGAQAHARKGGQCMMESISAQKDFQNSKQNISEFEEDEDGL